MILSDLIPLLNAQVEHMLPPTRSLTGAETWNGSTRHAARVIETSGRLMGPASREKVADAAATIWLLNHPRPIEIGDTFTLPSGEALKAIRVEYRTGGLVTFHKVYLS